MSQNLNSAVAVIGIDIGKNSFHVFGCREPSRARTKIVRGELIANFCRP